jgi:hypothetical protein
VSNDYQNQIRVSADASREPTSSPELRYPLQPPNIALCTPSLVALLLSGIGSGGVLGAADAVAFHYIVGGFTTPLAACLVGAGLGMVGGALAVVVRRAVWGRAIGVEVGTLLCLLYGIVPGLAVLYKSIFVTRVIGTWKLAAVVMACSMAGLVIGGLLDRILDGIIARAKPLQDRREVLTCEATLSPCPPPNLPCHVEEFRRLSQRVPR